QMPGTALDTNNGTRGVVQEAAIASEKARLSPRASRQPAAELEQPARGRTKTGQRRTRLGLQRCDARIRRGNAEQGYVGRLALRGVLAGGFSQALRGTFDIED